MKKVLTIALVLMLALSLFAGCGKLLDAVKDQIDDAINDGLNQVVDGLGDLRDGIDYTGDAKQWPDNDFTQGVPKAPFAVDSTLRILTSFTITFKDCTLDDMKAYAGQLENAGFAILFDSESDGEFYWQGQRDDGKSVMLISSTGTMVINMPDDSNTPDDDYDD